MGIEAVISRMCVQTAVYWGNPVSDGTGGYVYDSPIEITCRWENSNEMILLNNGEQCVSRAEVYVTQDLDVDGCLYLGALIDLESDPLPSEIEQAYVIKKFDKIPALGSSSEFLRKVYL